MTGTWVDVGMVVGILVVAITGWRAGVISTLAAFTGFIAGAFAGARLIPHLLADSQLPPLVRAGATLVGMLVLGLVGQAILGFLGRMVRDAVSFAPARVLDSASGMVVSTVAFLLCAWMLLSVAASLPTGGTSQAVRTSRAFPLLERVMAGPGGDLLDDARSLLGSLELPSLPFNPATLPPVADPVDIDLGPRVQRVARESVVQVETTSSRCSLSMIGSGVVIAPQRILTNAHVVEGAGRITVRDADLGPARGARLVLLDRADDLAVLYVPGLEAPAPPWVAKAARGTDAAVAGFPGGGDLTLRPARVRGEANVADDQGSGSRRVIVVSGVVQPGNSGGPLLDLDGRVLGLVFANSSLDDGTGFAISAADAAPVIARTADATHAVSSGPCPARS